MKVVTVVGARPQFIKASLLSAEFARAGISECLVHSGQHYDYNMSKIFFECLSMKAADHCLDVGSGSHAIQTANIMTKLEPIILMEKPDWVLVYGDTNTTLAGALVTAKLRVPLGHVEAGLRSFDRGMPEEINRVVTDHVSDALFVPTNAAAIQLNKEGITKEVHVVGDLMTDLVRQTAESLAGEPEVLARLKVKTGCYGIATVHRASNTDNLENFKSILLGLESLGFPVVFPVHPRTQPLLASTGLSANSNVLICEPLSYVEMIALEKHARVILTDSGGMQKEAFTLEVPCVTLRQETEWTETLEGGWNVLVGTNASLINRFGSRHKPASAPPSVFGNGNTASNIRSILEELVAIKRKVARV